MFLIYAPNHNRFVRLRGFTFRVLGLGIKVRSKVEGFMVRVQVWGCRMGVLG